ncbi:hypothetical protein, partial [Zoogloea sp.]|uniref:hypothetical protein n=1 Tax=Zoogloea sp. TaxID=49181 RepID=UPI0035AFBC04
ENKQTQVVRRGNLKRSVLNDSNRPVRTRMPGGVGGVGQVTWPPLSRLSPMALNVVVYLDVLWTWLQDLFVNPAAGRLPSL